MAFLRSFRNSRLNEGAGRRPAQRGVDWFLLHSCRSLQVKFPRSLPAFMASIPSDSIVALPVAIYSRCPGVDLGMFVVCSMGDVAAWVMPRSQYGQRNKAASPPFQGTFSTSGGRGQRVCFLFHLRHGIMTSCPDRTGGSARSRIIGIVFQYARATLAAAGSLPFFLSRILVIVKR